MAVDIANRSLLWGYLYSRSPQNAQNQVIFRGPVMAFNGDPNGSPLERWNDASATIAEGCVLITPPESNELHCVKLSDGQPVWHKPLERGENLYVACVHQGNVILAGKHQMTALRLSDGKPGWNGKPLELPEGAMPSGRGFASGDDYFLPLTSAEVAQVDLQTGKITARAKSHKGTIPGNLICSHGQVISQGVDYLETYFQLKPLEQRIAKAMKDNPDDAWALAHRGEIAPDEGRLNDALTDIRRSYKVDPDSFTRELLVEALTTALSQDFSANRAAVAELEKIVQFDPERDSFYRVLATGLQKTGDMTGALDVYVKLAGMGSPDEMQSVDSALSVARDRWVRGQFDAMLAETKPDQRRKIDASLEKSFDTKDANSLRQMIRYFGDHPLADRAREALVDQSGENEPLLERERLLRQLEKSSDPARRKSAMVKLAALLHAAGHDDDARLYYRRLEKEFGDKPLQEGKNAKQLMGALMPESSPRTDQSSAADWPEGEVLAEKSGVKQQRMPGFRVSSNLEIRGSREPFFQNITLDFDQQRMEVVGQDGLGQERFRQPLNEGGRMPNFFGGPNSLSYYATTNGHVVVLCLGMQAFAIDTLRGAQRPQSRAVDAIVNRSVDLAV